MDGIDLALPASKSRLGKLGKRLAGGLETPEDQALYVDVLDVYDRAQRATRAIIEASPWGDLLGVHDMDVTGRPKTRDTLIQKLQRSPQTQLPYIRDIAGVRVVADMCLLQQDVLARSLKKLFEAEDAPTVDRIGTPMHGYRALHIVVHLGQVPIEIQVRTRLQHMWAEVYERVADTYGRQIRYGLPPDPRADGDVTERVLRLGQLHRMSLDTIARYEDIRDKLFRIKGPITSGVMGEHFRERLPAPLTAEQAATLRLETDELDSMLVTHRTELEQTLLELGSLLAEEDTAPSVDD